MVGYELKYEKVPFEEIARLAPAAKKERSIIDNAAKNRTEWFAAYATLSDNENSVRQLVGCGGVMFWKGNEARIKGTFVVKPFRGMGISKRLNDLCLLAAMERQCSVCTAFVTVDRNIKWYLANGFRVLKQANGIATVRRIL